MLETLPFFQRAGQARAVCRRPLDQQDLGIVADWPVRSLFVATLLLHLENHSRLRADSGFKTVYPFVDPAFDIGNRLARSKHSTRPKENSSAQQTVQSISRLNAVPFVVIRNRTWRFISYNHSRIESNLGCSNGSPILPDSPKYCRTQWLFPFSPCPQSSIDERPEPLACLSVAAIPESLRRQPKARSPASLRQGASQTFFQQIYALHPHDLPIIPRSTR